MNAILRINQSYHVNFNLRSKHASIIGAIQTDIRAKLCSEQMNLTPQLYAEFLDIATAFDSIRSTA